MIHSVLTMPGTKLADLTYWIARRTREEGALYGPSNFAKVCPYCLEVWAKLDCGEGVFEVHSVPCGVCRWPPYNEKNVPGSILYHYYSQQTDWELLNDLCSEQTCDTLFLMRREVELHLKHIFKVDAHYEHRRNNDIPPTPGEYTIVYEQLVDNVYQRGLTPPGRENPAPGSRWNREDYRALHARRNGP